MVIGNANWITNNQMPSVTIKFNAQTKFKALSLFPGIWADWNVYNVPDSDAWCAAYRNRFMVTLTDVDDETYQCSDLEDISTYKETCSDKEAIQATISMDIASTN